MADGVPPVGGPPHAAAPLPGWEALINGPIARALAEKVPNAERQDRAYAEIEGYMSLLEHPTQGTAQALQARAVLSQEPMCFLTIIENPTDTEPIVSMIHTMGQFVTALGEIGPLEGNTFMFSGDKVEGNLPSILREPDGGITGAFTSIAQKVPTMETLEAHFQAEPASPLLPSNTDGADAVIHRLAFMPIAWAPLFLMTRTIKANLIMVNLIVQSAPEAQRPAYAYLQRWARTACVAHGPNNPRSHQSALKVSWRLFQSTPTFIRWASRHVNRIHNLAMLPTTAVATTQSVPAEIIAATVEAFKAMKDLEAKKPKESYTNFEKRCILAACSLREDEWDQAPPIYEEINEGGRSTRIVKSLLQQRLSIDNHSDDPVLIHVSSEMVADVKELRFATDYSLSYTTCHRGITPFAVPHTALARQEELKDQEDDLAAATTTTPGDIRSSRSKPPPCPKTYQEILRNMASYIRFLTVLFGDRCEHLRQVIVIRNFLREDSQTQFGLGAQEAARAYANIMWAIFRDARAFFASPHQADGTPPISKLFVTARIVLASNKLEITGCPLQQLLQDMPELLNSPSPSLATNLDPFSSPPSGGTRQGPLTNSKVDPKLEAVARAIKQAHPQVQMRALIASSNPKLRASDLQLARGGCLDYLIFGKCKIPGCSYKHNGVVETNKIDQVVAKLKPLFANDLDGANKRKRVNFQADT